MRHFFNRIQTVDVVIAKEGPNYMAEIIVKPDRRESFVGHGSGPDVKACIDLGLDKIERQVTKHKEKIRNRKHPNGPAEA